MTSRNAKNSAIEPSFPADLIFFIIFIDFIIRISSEIRSTNLFAHFLIEHHTCEKTNMPITKKLCMSAHGPLTRYLRLRVAHAPGMP